MTWQIIKHAHAHMHTHTHMQTHMQTQTLPHTNTHPEDTSVQTMIPTQWWLLASLCTNNPLTSKQSSPYSKRASSSDTYTCMQMCTQTQMCTCAHRHTLSLTQTQTHTHTCKQARTHTHRHTRARARTHTHTHTHTHMQAHMQTHTHTCTHTHTLKTHQCKPWFQPNDNWLPISTQTTHSPPSSLLHTRRVHPPLTGQRCQTPAAWTQSWQPIQSATQGVTLFISRQLIVLFAKQNKMLNYYWLFLRKV